MAVALGRRRRTVVMLAAMLLVLVAGFAPGIVPIARAADDFLRLSADATYRVVPDDGLVRVIVDWRATNLRPNTVRRTANGTVTSRYFFDRLVFDLPRDARSIVAESGGSRLTTSVRDRDRYREVVVRFPNLFYQQSRSIRVQFALPGGKPRSDSDVRVGAAFTTFAAWAWGDAGRSTVRIVLPLGFDDEGYGEDVAQRTQPDHLELTSGSIDRPDSWYHVVVAHRPSELTDLSVEAGGRSVVVRAWPEDVAWRDRVADVLDTGVPVLEDLVGLPWPLSGELQIKEVHTPLLEGYAGFYDTSTDEITISEDLDDQTILHEVSHAWFHDDLVRGRWIDEGLAEYYADRAREELGLSDLFDPTVVEPDAKGAFRLNDWPDPSRIDDAEAEAQELFGYAAAYTVIRTIAEEIGDDAMRAVLAAAHGQHNAYAGDNGPERTGAAPDWRRFLDLVEELGRIETADDLFARWVVSPMEERLLETRETARDAYAELDAAADEWAVPLGVRAYMSLWRFDQATSLIDAAEPVVALRDDLADASSELGLSTPADLEAKFEEAVTPDELTALAGTVEERIAAADAVADARHALEVQRTPIAALGLVGDSPDGAYMAARTAFESGDVAAATAAAATTMSLLAGAESIGITRALMIGGVVIGLLLMLAVLFVVLRRRRRRLALSSAAWASTTLPATPEPEAARPAVPSTPNETAPGAEPD